MRVVIADPSLLHVFRDELKASASFVETDPASNQNSLPLAGVKLILELRFRNMAVRSWPASSLSVKYQCPDAGREKLEISPSTNTAGNCPSSSDFAARLSSLTL